MPTRDDPDDINELRALRALLDDDAAWGQRSGTDVPPPHLFDAILRAEVAARPDEIRQAVALAQTPKEQQGLWARMSRFLLGGGVAVGAAALVLIVTIDKTPAELTTPAATADALAAPTLKAPDPAEALAQEPAPQPGPVEAPIGAVAEPAQAEKTALSAKSDAKLAEAQVLAPRESKAAPPKKPSKDDAPARPDVERREYDGDASVGAEVNAPKEEPPPPQDEFESGFAYNSRASGGLNSGTSTGDIADKKAATNKKVADKKAMELDDDEERLSEKSAKSAKSINPPPPSSAPVAPSTPAQESKPRIVTAEEAGRAFRERMKDAAKRKASDGAKKEAAKQDRPASKQSASSVGSGSYSGDAVREQMARDRQVQEANSMLVAAERELSQRRYDSAVDLAIKAEASAGGALGLAPASTQAQGFTAMRRYADAARVASRLVNGNVKDSQQRAGMRAGVDAAMQIGDLRLAERLLVRLSHKDNDDADSRAEAEKMLSTLRTKTSAPAAAKSKAAEAAAADMDDADTSSKK